MDLDSTYGETWVFEVVSGRADQVFLMQEWDGRSHWVPMQPDPAEPGGWRLTVRLAPGRFRFRYYIAEGPLFINAGATGLVALRVAGDDPGVFVAPLDEPAERPELISA